MMPDALDSLREVNGKLRNSVLGLRPERKHIWAIGPDDFLNVRRLMLRARECLRLLRAMNEESGDVRKELLEYQHNLAKLKQLLPDLHARLLTEKLRLHAVRTQAAAASHWAQAARSIP